MRTISSTPAISFEQILLEYQQVKLLVLERNLAKAVQKCALVDSMFEKKGVQQEKAQEIDKKQSH